MLLSSKAYPELYVPVRVSIVSILLVEIDDFTSSPAGSVSFLEVRFDFVIWKVGGGSHVSASDL